MADDFIDIDVGSGPGAVDFVDVQVLDILLEATPLAHSVSLKWNAPAAGQTVQSYNIKRSPGNQTPSVFATIGSVAGTVQTFTDSDPKLVEGAGYVYEVTAVNTGGESLASNIVSASIPFSVPAAPTGLVVVSAV